MSPPVIVAFLGVQALGDFVMEHQVLASLVRAHRGSKLAVIYRDDRPYKNLVTLMNPYVAATLKLSNDPGEVAPLDWFDGDANAPGRPFDAPWYEQGFHNPDVFLTPSMMTIGRCLGKPPGLRFPPKIAPPLAAALRQKGVDDKRWFACLHMREADYAWRKTGRTPRNVDPGTYLPMIEDVISKQGGQVVRLGDPSMTALPNMDGLIDLSRDEDTFPLQAFALSRARYFMGTDSGPTQLAGALKVPAATTNACAASVWNDGDVVLMKKFTLPDGRVLSYDELLDLGILTLHTRYPDGITVVDNAPEDLRAVAAHMFEITSDCPGWRSQAEEDEPLPPSQALVLPLKWRHSTGFADLTFWEPS